MGEGSSSMTASRGNDRRNDRVVQEIIQADNLPFCQWYRQSITTGTYRIQEKWVNTDFD